MKVKLFGLLALAATMIFALACSNGGGNIAPSTPTTTVSGTIETGSTSSKALQKTLSGSLAYTNLVGIATVVGGTTTYNVIINSTGAYTSTIGRGIDVNIEIKTSTGEAVLSRVLTKTETASSTVTAVINPVTTVMAKLVVANVALGNDVANSFTAVSYLLFGSATLPSVLKASSITNTALAARVANYESVLDNVSAGADLSLGLAMLTTYQNSFVAAVAQLASIYAAIVAGSSASVITAAAVSAATALIAAVNVSITAAIAANPALKDVENAASQTSLNNNPTLKDAISENATGTGTTVPTPVVTTATLTYASAALSNSLVATPGVLFTATGDAATQSAGAAITYSGAWTTAPAADSSYSFDTTTRVLKVIPSVSDIGKTLVYTVTATSGTLTATQTISVAVKALQLKGIRSAKLGGSTASATTATIYQPKAAAMTSNYLYVVSLITGSTSILERYSVADLAENGDTTGDAVVTAASVVETSLTGLTNVSDIVAADDTTVYVADGTAGVVKVVYSGTTGTATTISATPADDIALYGSTLYGVDTSASKALSYNAAATTSTAATDISTSTAYNSVGVTGSYVYFMSTMTAATYSISATGTLGLVGSFTSTMNHLIPSLDALNTTTAYYVTSASAVTRSALSSAPTQTVVAVGVTPAYKPVAYGTQAFYKDSSAGVVKSVDMYGTTVTTSAQDTAVTSLVAPTANELPLLVRNVPAGIATNKTGSYIYSIGQYTATGTPATTQTGTWYIKSYRAEPID